jgi:hypothetical protein
LRWIEKNVDTLPYCTMKLVDSLIDNPSAVALAAAR